MAGQAGSVGLAALTFEQRVGERPGVPRVVLFVMHALVTFGARLRTGILRGRPGDFEECVRLQIGEGGDAFQVWGAGGLPCLIRQTRFQIQLIISSRPVPRDIEAVGGFGNSGHHWATGEAAGLGHAQVLNLFRAYRS